jgi:TolA-binding protein
MKKLLIIPVALFFLASCKSESDKANEKAAQDSVVKMQARQNYVQAVKHAEDSMRASGKYDQKLAVATIKAYNDFTVMFPNDSLTPEYLFRAADLAQGTHNYQQAAVYLETIIEKHKGYPKYVDACFVAAYVYDSYLENVNHGDDRARQLYNFVITNYPNTSYAEQSKVLVNYVGKPDSVLLNDIMNKGGK